MLLAWAGVRANPKARRYLDLGSGKGTVALLVLDRLKACTAVGVEAFEQSHQLAVRNAQLNALTDRYTPLLYDLRDWPAPAEPFDLVGGAPPFMPVGTGVLPKDPQRAAGRFELRGGVEEYALAAARSLAPDGVAVLLMDGHGRRRGLLALKAAGLGVYEVLEVAPRPEQPPTYWIFSARHAPCAAPTEGRLEMRDATGDHWSQDYAAARQLLDLW